MYFRLTTEYFFFPLCIKITRARDILLFLDTLPDAEYRNIWRGGCGAPLPNSTRGSAATQYRGQ